MIAYKGFRPGLICRGYQFVMGLNLVKMIRNIAIGNTTHTVTLNSPLNKPTILYSLVKSLDINAFPRC